MADDLMYIGHMYDMALRVKRLTAGADRSALDSDEKLQLALVRALQIIGEAAWRTSQPFRLANPSIPWKQIAGFRHRAVHDYFAIDYDIVWQIATAEIDPLIRQLRPLLPSSLP
jgi:uncharacterized protein with HEPN domain